MKSPPELWAECSDATSLSRHLSGSFGEIHITRLEPETAVAWEGEHASGTVRLEASGWGTKVILTARPGGEPEPVFEPEPLADPEPGAEPEPVVDREPELEAERPAHPPGPGRLFARLTRFLKPAPPVPTTGTIQLTAPEPAPDPEPAPQPPPPPDRFPRTHEKVSEPPFSEALAAALESLGQAHHRPYSRA